MLGCLGTLTLFAASCFLMGVGAYVAGLGLGPLGLIVFWVLWAWYVPIGPTCCVCQSCGTTWFER